MAGYRKRTYRRRPLAKKRLHRKKRYRKALVKRKAYNQNFELKCEMRVNMRGASYNNGSEGVRAAIYWGNTPDAAATNWPDVDHLLYPFNTYEWNHW